MQNYIVGYGSLLSHDSRHRFSNLDIDPIYVVLKGWSRSWSVPCAIERQTYVGVHKDENLSVNAVLIPTEEITSELLEREKNYTFVEVDPADLKVTCTRAKSKTLPQGRFWICEPKHFQVADSKNPINQTYVDTCLIGCLESGNQQVMQQFIQSTSGWENGWHNDRNEPKYPRAATASDEQLELIDQLLERAGILIYRT